MNEESNVKKEWLQQYDALATRFNEIYLKATARGREEMEKALEKAEAELVATKTFTSERGAQLKNYLLDDLDQTIDTARQLGETAKQHIDPERLEAGAQASIAGILEWVGGTMLGLGHKVKEDLTCKTGGITSAGTLTCQSCGQQIHMKKTGHIPPCPKCKGTVFTKSY